MIKIAVCVPVWRRPKMREAFLNHMRRHVELSRDYGVALSVCVSGSEGTETQREATMRGFHYIEVPNEPLGAKFNAAIDLASLAVDPDAYMILGSDTFFLPTLWGAYFDLLNEGHPYIGVKDMYQWDWRDNRAAYWHGYIGKREGEAIGPGRLITRQKMEKPMLKYGGIYQSDLNRSLDASATRRLGHPHLISGKEHLLVSCKGEESITPFSALPDEQLEYVDYKMLEGLLSI